MDGRVEDGDDMSSHGVAGLVQAGADGVFEREGIPTAGAPPPPAAAAACPSAAAAAAASPAATLTATGGSDETLQRDPLLPAPGDARRAEGGGSRAGETISPLPRVQEGVQQADPPSPLRTEIDGEAAATGGSGVEEGDHDSWKDFSCATKWEYFINDVDNAIGMLEQQAAAAAAAAAAGPRGRQELTYLGRSYWLRRLHSRGRDGDGKDGESSCDFPDSLGSFGEHGGELREGAGQEVEGDCPPLDAWFVSHSDPPARATAAGKEDAHGDEERRGRDRELREEEQASRVLRGWFGFGDFLCLHEAAGSASLSSRSGGVAERLSLEQLLSTGVMAMEGRRCGAVLAVERAGGNPHQQHRRQHRRERDHRAHCREKSWRGVSVKGYAILHPASGGGGGGEWTRRAEAVRMESATSLALPRFRRSPEALGELLEDKALSAWGRRRGSGGRLEASARYMWQRRLYDGRLMGEEGDDGDDAWQTEWRTRFWRERSHRNRGARDCAVRALLAAAEGEYGTPAWGPDEDPLDAVQVTAVWEGLGGDRPLPHAPLELLDVGGEVFSPPPLGGEGGGGGGVRGPSFDWNAAVTWETANRTRSLGLGLKLRLLLAVYVHCLALGGDLLMSDICGPDAEDELSSARERARHIGAVLGPSTRELVARMATAPRSIGGGGGGDATDDEDRADPAEIGHCARYLLTPRAVLPSASASASTTVSASAMASVSAPASESRPLSVPAPASVSASGSASPSPESPPSLGEGDVGEEAAAAAVDEGRDGGDVDEGSWLCVPRGGAPACRLVSQVALEAARFGADGVRLEDVAAFWKAFVQELRFLWEEGGALVPRMDPDPPVDGTSMYDSRLTGQDAGRSAQLRRHIAVLHPPTPSPEEWEAGCAMGASPPPPPPDMRCCLLHQKLQMLNCCLAELSRSRRRSPPPENAGPRGRDHGGSGGGGGGSGDSGGEGRTEEAGADVQHAPSDEAVTTAGDAQGPTLAPNGSRGVAGDGSDGGGQEGGLRSEKSAEVAQYQERKMKQDAFAAERDAILRRVGVKKESTGGDRGGGGGGGGGGHSNDGGRGGGGWWGFGGGGANDGERGKAASAASAGDTSPEPLSPGARARSKSTPEARREPAAASARGRDAGTASAGTGATGVDATLQNPRSVSSSPPPRPREKVSGAVRKVGGAVKKVGGATARKVGSAVQKVRDNRAGVSAAGGEVELFARIVGNPEMPGIDIVQEEEREEEEVEEEVDAASLGQEMDDDGMVSLEQEPVGSCSGSGSGSGGGVDAASATSGALAAGAAAKEKVYAGFRLLVAGKRAVVPELLPACPLTLDMLEQQRELVRRLSFAAESSSGRDAQLLSRTRGSQLRLAALSADMRRFLEGNPGAVFADFVRWYSPLNWAAGAAERRNGAEGEGGGSDYVGAEGRDVVAEILAELIERVAAAAGGVVASSPEAIVPGQAPESVVASLSTSRPSSPSQGLAVSSSAECPTTTALEATPPPPPPPPAAPALADDAPEDDGVEGSGGRLDWGLRGGVVWRSASGEGTGVAPPASGGHSGGVDEKEGSEWLETWLEVEVAAAAAAAAVGVAGGGGDSGGGEVHPGVYRQKALFNPAQEAEKALHYIETIGPAQLVSQLLIALAGTSRFLLSKAQTDALDLPCVKAALSRVESTVLRASEGLFEASSGGGILLMGDRVAHPVSQATLVACDALCDAVDEAETLLSRGTSLLHKLPGEHALVEALVTTNVATAAGCRNGDNNSSGGGSIFGGKTSRERLGARGSIAAGSDAPLEALARYLASGPPVSETPTPTAAGAAAGQATGDAAAGATTTPAAEGEERERGGGIGGASGATSDAAQERLTSESSPPATTAAAVVAGGDDRKAAPKPRVEEYSMRWRLPRLFLDQGGGVEEAGEEEEEEEDGIGARLYARVTNTGWSDGVGGGRDDGSDGGGNEEDDMAEVRLAVAVAEPASALSDAGSR